MMQTFALQTVIKKLGHNPKILNFSNLGQQRLYRTLFPVNSIKNIVKNVILLPHKSKIDNNNRAYERFISENLIVDGKVINNMGDLSDDPFDIIVTGSDQVWNVTIEDGDLAYFLPWVKKAKKVAYAPSFGAKNPAKYAEDPRQIANLLKDIDFLSIRENNGKDWIKDLVGVDAEVVLDPTLLLVKEDYESLEANLSGMPSEYIFYYSPGFSSEINDLIEAISEKYKLPVIAFSAKSYYIKGMNFTSSFALPEYENPSVYLSLIKNASMVFTTSFHGTIFSILYGKVFWTVKNGGMFGDDDRVRTLLNMLELNDRLCAIEYDNQFDYRSEPNWDAIYSKLHDNRLHSMKWLEAALR